jgi:hypothetical protein
MVNYLEHIYSCLKLKRVSTHSHENLYMHEFNS